MLEDTESTRGDRNGTIRVEGGRVAVTLEEWDDQTELPSRGDDGEPQDKVEEREQKVKPPRKGDFEIGVREAVRARRRLVTPGQCRNKLVVGERCVKSALLDKT